MDSNLLKNPHAGEIIAEEFLKELGMSIQELADAIRVSYFRLSTIIAAESPMTAEIDLRSCRYFKLSEGYFLRLQNAYDLMEAKRQFGVELNQIMPHPSLIN